MNLFRTLPHKNFLSIVAEFIIKNFANRMDSLKVIVPTGLIATNLQKAIIEKCGATILPEIVPYPKVITSGEEMFKIPSENIESLSYLEEKIILAELIKNYKKLKYNNLQSLKFAPLLANLFNQLILNNINICDISKLPTLSKAEHWQFIYEFLYYSYTEWQKQIKSLNKTTKAEYLIAMLNAEKERFKNENYFIIAAGFFGYDNTSWEFLKNIASHKNGFIILPPIPGNLEEYKNTNKDILNNFYCLNKFLSIIKKNITDFKQLGYVEKINTNILDNIILQQTPNPSQRNNNDLSNIQYIECDNVFEEAELISLICKNHINKKIAIVVTNNKCKNCYTIFLQKYDIKFNDRLGQDLQDSNICQLIINFSELLCNEFSLKNLFIFLKNPIIFSSNVINFEQLLLGKNRFVENLEQIHQIVHNTNNTALIYWWKEISNVINLFKVDNNNCNFEFILKSIIAALDRLLPYLWQCDKQYPAEVSAFFSELLDNKLQPSCSSIDEFPIILKSILNGAKKYEIINDDYNIYICMPEDASLIKFDVVILADFTEESWPPVEEINPWLNKQMQEELEFYPEHIKNFSYIYYFYLLLHTQEVFITRSKNHGSSTLLTSNYIRILQYLLQINTQLYSKLSYIKSVEINNELSKTNILTNISFPTQISVTDIEMLVRNPYSFYVKKILKLRKIDSINAPAGILEYGNYLHMLIDNYTKSYNSTTSNKIKKLLELASKLLTNTLLPTSIRKAWYIKTNALAEEFITFDENRRTNTVVYSEIRGKLTLDILGSKIEIIGIADRIEIDDAGNCSIIDFKTGTLPSSKDVYAGLSPQLIILTLIAIENGFSLTINKIKSLNYVKLGNSKPYIQLVEYNISIEELNRHKSAIISLLEYYIKNMDFSSNVDLLKYNDYKHFARNLS